MWSSQQIFFFLNNSKNPSFIFWNWMPYVIENCWFWLLVVSLFSLGSSSFLLPFTLTNWKACQAVFDFSWYTVNSLSYMHRFFLNLRRVLLFLFHPSGSSPQKCFLLVCWFFGHWISLFTIFSFIIFKSVSFSLFMWSFSSLASTSLNCFSIVSILLFAGSYANLKCAIAFL